MSKKLNHRKYGRSTSWKIDFDYIDKLNPAELKWLSKFTDEHYLNGYYYTHNTNPLLSHEQAKECKRDAYRASLDVQNLAHPLSGPMDLNHNVDSIDRSNHSSFSEMTRICLDQSIAPSFYLDPSARQQNIDKLDPETILLIKEELMKKSATKKSTTKKSGIEPKVPQVHHSDSCPNTSPGDELPFDPGAPMNQAQMEAGIRAYQLATQILANLTTTNPVLQQQVAEAHAILSDVLKVIEDDYAKNFKQEPIAV